MLTINLQLAYYYIKLRKVRDWKRIQDKCSIQGVRANGQTEGLKQFKNYYIVMWHNSDAILLYT